MTSGNRKRLNDLPEKVARRIDDAILDLADGRVEGRPTGGGRFRFINRHGDEIVYSVDAQHLYVQGFTTPHER